MEEFAEQARGLTVISLRVTAVVMIVLTVLAWPTDLWIFERASPQLHAIFAWRVWVLGACIAGYIGLRSSRFLSSHPFLVALVALTLPVGASGWLMGRVGGLGSPLTYGIYTVPLLTVLLVVELRSRALATASLVVAYFLCFFAATPGLMTNRAIGTPLVWSVASSITAIVVGHVVYVLLRSNFVQRRQLDRLTGDLKALVAEQTVEIRQLASDISSVQEEERARIAHDLHDDLGQLLVRLGMEAQMLAGSSGDAASLDDASRNLGRLIESIHEALDRVLGALQPRALDEQGFDVALTRMVREIAARGGFAAQTEIGVDVDPFSPSATITLFRIVEEAMTNISRHARAQNARVLFDSKDGQMELRISDDGVGFSAGNMRQGDRMGLKGIVRRSRILGGDIEIRARPGEGCEIVILFPMEGLVREALP